MAAVKGQCHTLLGRLEDLGPGAAAAAGSRREATAKEQKWKRAERQGRNVLRKEVCIAVYIYY